MSQMQFPIGFLWGTATSAHQVEGDNVNNDWYAWEGSEERQKALRQEGKKLEDFISDQACGHYHRFEEDIDLVRAGGQNAHRLSLEWARIEPRVGEWDKNELSHYREVLKALRHRGIKTFVTLWHFTNPQWFSEKGGWLKGKDTHDFLGLNYYIKTRFLRPEGTLIPQRDDVRRYGRETSDIGFEIHPHGLFDVIMDLAHLRKPIYITENGIATDDDARRQRFIIAHIQELYYAIAAGADVRGYFYWSLLDNFEWHEGWRMKFGLVAVDRKTFERKPKESYYLYKKIAEQNGLDNDKAQSSNAK